MRRAIYILLLVAMAASAQKPTDRTIYLDSVFSETSEGQHQYYRVVTDYHKNRLTYHMVDYYKSGNIHSQRYSAAKSHLRPIGLETHYHENGRTKSTVTYEDDAPTGPFKQWYADGSPEMEGEYVPTKKEGIKTGANISVQKILQFWDADKQQTVKDGNGYCEIYDEKTCSEGKVKNGLKDSIWVGYDSDIHSTYVENYRDGELTVGVSKDKTDTRRIYRVIEQKPEFPGGINVFYQYVMRNFRVPETPGIKGKVFISFVVEKDGAIDRIKIIRSLGKEVDDEAIRIISESPLWNPGKKRGVAVGVLYSLPIAITSHH